MVLPNVLFEGPAQPVTLTLLPLPCSFLGCAPNVWKCSGHSVELQDTIPCHSRETGVAGCSSPAKPAYLLPNTLFPERKFIAKQKQTGTSLAVRWLRLHTSAAVGLGIPGQRAEDPAYCSLCPRKAKKQTHRYGN